MDTLIDVFSTIDKDNFTVSFLWFMFTVYCLWRSSNHSRRVGSRDLTINAKIFTFVRYYFLGSYTSTMMVYGITKYWPASIVAGVLYTVIWLTFVVFSYYEGQSSQ